MAKGLIVMGAVLLAVGAWMAWGPKIPFLGKLPGDIVIRRESFTFYFPLATCILISVILTLIMRWFGPK
jgi:hypothetical protein